MSIGVHICSNGSEDNYWMGHMIRFPSVYNLGIGIKGLSIGIINWKDKVSEV